MNQHRSTIPTVLKSAALWLLIGILCISFQASLAAEKNDDSGSKADEQKEDKIDNLEDKIDALEDEIGQKRKTERTINTEIEIIDKSVQAIELQMEKSKQVVDQLEQSIEEKDVEIEKLQQEILKQKDMLGEYIRRMSQSGQESDLIFMESGGSLEDYFNLVDSYERMQEEVSRMLSEIQTSKDELDKQREELDDKHGQQQQVYLIQQDQNRTLEYEQKRKERLLSQTQKDLDILSVERDELRAQLNALQSLGSTINLEEAIEIAEYASGRTGARTAFLLGVLRVESNMGQNVGGGRYKSDMNPTQHDLFKKICSELDLKASDMPVSKRVCYNTKSKDGCGGWGGAMGPAQFMPSTWMGYKDKVAKVTGHNPPNPWNLKDALVAMGLKLAVVPGVTDHKESAERKAAAMYLAGGNWESYPWYGDRVMYYADGFEKYMKD